MPHKPSAGRRNERVWTRRVRSESLGAFWPSCTISSGLVTDESG